jgi:competence protein ComEC
LYNRLLRYSGVALLLVLTLAACTLPSPGQTLPAPTDTLTIAAVTQEPTPTPAPAATFIPEPTPSSTPEPAVTATPPSATTGTLRAHFINVGQGDATLLEGEGFAILIDAGRHTGDEVVPYLQTVGIQELDLLIGTHPHADHIGQFPQVLAALPVKEVWLSGDPHTTLTFERALDAIAASDAGYHEPRAGETYTIGPVQIEVVNPADLTGHFHEGSISIRISYGGVRFIFTGDAETPTEQAMIDRGHALEAQVLQLGHHGSRTSTTAVFLEAVQPEVAIYSAGEGNSYGHPHQEVIDRLAGLNIPVYGTDIHGTIVVSTDGAAYQVLTEREGTLPTVDTRTPTPVPAGCRLGQMNVNTATATELIAIIHISTARAEELVDLRPFTSVDDLTRISGIGSARVVDIKEQDLACAGR